MKNIPEGVLIGNGFSIKQDDAAGSIAVKCEGRLHLCYLIYYDRLDIVFYGERRAERKIYWNVKSIERITTSCNDFINRFILSPPA